MTQVKAYKLIREMTSVPARRVTESRLVELKSFLGTLLKTEPQESQIWEGWRSMDFHRKERIFLWKLMDYEYKV